MFTQAQIPVVMAAFQKMADAIQTGKNLDVVKANAALLLPKLDAVVMAHKQVEDFAIALHMQVPESITLGLQTLADMKKLIVDMIVAAEQLMQKQSVQN